MWKRRRPQVSFFLASCMLLVIIGWSTGLLTIGVDPTAIQRNPTNIAHGILYAVLMIMLLYEW